MLLKTRQRDLWASSALQNCIKTSFTDAEVLLISTLGACSQMFTLVRAGHSHKMRHLGQSGTWLLFQSVCCCSQLSRQAARQFPAYHSPSGKWSHRTLCHHSWKERTHFKLHPTTVTWVLSPCKTCICRTFTHTSFNIPVTTDRDIRPGWFWSGFYMFTFTGDYCNSTTTTKIRLMMTASHSPPSL